MRNDISKLKVEITDFESGKIYRNALEWRLEFPQILNDRVNDDGDFIGFDVVIGNPPYVRESGTISKSFKPILEKNYQCYTGKADLFICFYELGLNLLKAKGYLAFISSNKYFRSAYGRKLRQLLKDSTTINNLIDFGDFPIFEGVDAYPSIIILSKVEFNENQLKALNWDKVKEKNNYKIDKMFQSFGLTISQEILYPDGWLLEEPQILNLFTKLQNVGRPLGEYINGSSGFKGIRKANEKDRLII